MGAPLLQYEACPLLRGQLGDEARERAFHALPLVECFVHRVPLFFVVCLPKGKTSLPAAREVDALVVCDAKKPSLERTSLPQLVETVEGEDERLLEHVFAVAGAPRHSGAEAVQIRAQRHAFGIEATARLCKNVRLLLDRHRDLGTLDDRGRQKDTRRRHLPLPSRWLHPGQQQGRRIPSSSSSLVRRMRRSLVICCLASSTQQMNSLRASGVMSFQAASATGLATSALRRSAGSSCTTPPGTPSLLTRPR